MGLSVQSIRKAIRDGRLSGTFRVGREILVPENAILEYRNFKHGAYVGLYAMRKAKKAAELTKEDGEKLHNYRDQKKRFYGIYDD